MPTSRRNMIAGLGALTVGGGAVFGSGAFSSTEADRELTVNVVTDSAIAEDFVDVILNDVGTTDTVDVDDGADSPASDLFPTSSTADSEYNNYTPDENDVSLMQNDVTIIFGPSGSELPPNSNVSFDGLLTIVNEAGDGQDFDVSFNVGTDNGDTGFAFDPADEEVPSDSAQDVGVDVNTGSEASTDGTLTITIEENNN